MLRKNHIDWPLLWSAIKADLGIMLTMLCVGIITTAVGGGIFYVDFGDWGAMIAGGFFALMGAGLVLLAIVTTYSGASYLYGQALLRKHGVEVDGVLTKKEADCQFYQEYDHRNEPQGEGYYQCNLLIEFNFQFDGQNHSGAFYLSKLATFDKLREGDPVPLKVLRFDPSVHKVRERRLANMLKGREPQMPSLVPEGAEIGQLA
ncbi:DUF3592 domain-containing protein [Marinobacter daepoensis]|uniref:DUF3592 domain-containing protein n=2 Tax=Marinobacter daepoensis TaxID=262077 RepID=A0ABS3BJ78_9GAMM|nr:DUF3592 domain-containing protein [Marinobacter daepoensis]MBY6080925.1 DUF3592 domain-containing protein [Marinobacter daepoensis]